jgi:hypothetical protein
LQLADPIPAGSEYQVWNNLQVLLEVGLIELRIVEGREARGQTPEGPDEPELSNDDVSDITKLRLPHELESMLGLALDVAKRISGGQQNRDQTVAGIDRVFEVTGLLRRGKGAPQQFETGAEVP